jgi:hypothetical protein
LITDTVGNVHEGQKVRKEAKNARTVISDILAVIKMHLRIEMVCSYETPKNEGA